MNTETGAWTGPKWLVRISSHGTVLHEHWFYTHACAIDRYEREVALGSEVLLAEVHNRRANCRISS